MLPKKRRRGPVMANEIRTRRPAAAAILARRRRSVYHAAAGLHRRCRAARPAALEPRHVSHPTLRRAVPAGRAKSACTIKSIAASACITPRPIRGGEPLRVNIFVGGTPAMTLAAVMPLPEGMSRTRLRRRAGRPSHSDDRRGGDASADLRRGRFLHHRHRRSREEIARRPVRRSPGLLQSGPRFPRAAGGEGLSSRRARSGPSRSSAARRRKTLFSAS